MDRLSITQGFSVKMIFRWDIKLLSYIQMLDNYMSIEGKGGK